MNRKIIITGTTCTGKTTLGKKLAKVYSIKQIDLDDFHFLPN
jgi:shikimate kinase